MVGDFPGKNRPPTPGPATAGDTGARPHRGGGRPPVADPPIIPRPRRHGADASSVDRPPVHNPPNSIFAMPRCQPACPASRLQRTTNLATPSSHWYSVRHLSINRGSRSGRVTASASRSPSHRHQRADPPSVWRRPDVPQRDGGAPHVGQTSVPRSPLPSIDGGISPASRASRTQWAAVEYPRSHFAATAWTGLGRDGTSSAARYTAATSDNAGRCR